MPVRRQCAESEPDRLLYHDLGSDIMSLTSHVSPTLCRTANVESY